MMWDSDWGAGQWIAMSATVVAFWGLVVVAIVALVRVMRPDRPSPPDEPNARRILDERLARGEVDLDEYSRRRELLDGS